MHEDRNEDEQLARTPEEFDHFVAQSLRNHNARLENIESLLTGIKDVLEGAQSAFKFLSGLSRVVTWTWRIGVAITAGWQLIEHFFNGRPPPPHG